MTRVRFPASELFPFRVLMVTLFTLRASLVSMNWVMVIGTYTYFRQRSLQQFSMPNVYVIFFIFCGACSSIIACFEFLMGCIQWIKPLCCCLCAESVIHLGIMEAILAKRAIFRLLHYYDNSEKWVAGIRCSASKHHHKIEGGMSLYSCA